MAAPTSSSSNSILKFPESLGREFTVQSGRGFAQGELGPDKQSRNQEPYVMFLPYKRPFGLAAAQNAGNADVFSSVPENDKNYIVLPLPPSALSTKINANYTEAELGQIPSFLNTIQGAYKAAASISGAAGSGDMSLAGKMMLKAGGDVVSDLGTQAAVGLFQSLSHIVPDVGNAAKALTGYTENPFSETMFQNVSFREHTFDYEFTPLTEKEAERIDEIIQKFKYYMLPDLSHAIGLTQLVTGEQNEQSRLNGLLLSFPYQFIIRYSVESTTFRLMPSVLKSISVNYGGQDKAPNFYRASSHGKNWPSRINVALEFQEIIFLSRGRVATDKKTYDVSSGTVKYRF